MLWNTIYEFYVKYIFGGYYGNARYDTYFGRMTSSFNGTLSGFSTTEVFTSLGFKGENGALYYLAFGNYLSLIATIISMVVIVVLACLFIKKIYNMVAHVIA